MPELVAFVVIAALAGAALLLLHRGQRGHGDDGEPPTLDTRNHVDDGP